MSNNTMKTPKPTAKELAGMTLNERLCACGLLGIWEQNLRARNREEMISILSTVGLASRDATYTVDAVLADPRRFGPRN